VSGGNSAPDGSKSVVSFAGVSLVDIDYSLAEVVLSSFAIVDSLESKDDLAGVKGDF